HRDNPVTALNKWARRNPTRAAVATVGLFFLMIGVLVVAGVRAKVAADRADQADRLRAQEKQTMDEINRRLNAEEAARAQAERTAELEKTARERERLEAERLARRAQAFTPYSRGADLRSRSASLTDWNKRADMWRQAVNDFQQALQLDDSF